MNILIFILIFVIVGLLVYTYSIKNSVDTINEKVKQENQQLYKESEEINQKNQQLLKEYEEISKNLDNIKIAFSDENQNYQNIKQESLLVQKELSDSKNHLNDIQNNIIKTTETQKELSQKAFENYCEILNKQYEEQEQDYELYKKNLEDSYNNRQIALMKELDSVQENLDKIKATRDAAIKAQLKEQEIKEKLTFYCLSIPQNNLDDIKILNGIKVRLHNPRILSMLIWKTYFQDATTKLCENVLGSSTVCGIYKITNQTNNMCYVGRSTDIKRRWTEHIKCGLDIDCPANNKLYKAMQDEGLQNFSFEVLEVCPREQLDEKEKYYIELYQSVIYGYNILTGAINRR
jgi:hypothetical protein